MKAKPESLLRVMAKKELVKIEVHETDTGKVFVISRNISGLNPYQKLLATRNFIDKQPKLMELALEEDLRQVFIDNGISVNDCSKDALKRSFDELNAKGISIDLVDRYKDTKEKIISSGDITIINESDILSMAMEIVRN